MAPPDTRRDVAPQPPPLCPPDCPDCAKQSAQDWADIEAEQRAVLDAHDDGCVTEAIAGHDQDETAWSVAAQLLEDGHSPCRCNAVDQVPDVAGPRA